MTEIIQDPHRWIIWDDKTNRDSGLYVFLQHSEEEAVNLPEQDYSWGANVACQTLSEMAPN